MASASDSRPSPMVSPKQSLVLEIENAELWTFTHVGVVELRVKHTFTAPR